MILIYILIITLVFSVLLFLQNRLMSSSSANTNTQAPQESVEKLKLQFAPNNFQLTARELPGVEYKVNNNNVDSKTIYVIGKAHDDDEISPCYDIYTTLEDALAKYQQLGELDVYDFSFSTYVVASDYNIEDVRDAMRNNRSAWFSAVGDGRGA